MPAPCGDGSNMHSGGTVLPMSAVDSNTSHSRRRISSIQGLRGIAALLVVIAHSVDSAQTFGPQFLQERGHLANFGAVGVDLFFVISGFVMAYSVAGGKDGVREASFFLVNRWIRVAPPYLVVSLVLLLLAGLAQAAVLPRKVLFALLFVPWIPAQHAPPTGSVLNLLLFVPWADTASFSEPPLPVGWTLSFEFTFYLMVAAMVALGQRRRIGWLAVGLVIVVVVGRIVPLNGFLWSWFTNPILLEFAMGIAAYSVWRTGALDRARWLGLSVGAVGAAALVLTAIFGYGQISEAGFVLDGSLSMQRALVWGLPCAAVFVGVISVRQRRSTLLSRATAGLGDASYSVYLVHIPVLAAVVALVQALHPTAPPALVLLLCVPAGVAGGFVMHRVLERPLTRRLQVLVRGLRAPSGPTRRDRRSAVVLAERAPAVTPQRAEELEPTS